MIKRKFIEYPMRKKLNLINIIKYYYSIIKILDVIKFIKHPKRRKLTVLPTLATLSWKPNTMFSSFP